MSFLLLKSRSGRPPAHRGKNSDSNPNPPIASRNKNSTSSQGLSHASRRSSNGTFSTASNRALAAVNAGGGQVQLQRPVQQQKRQLRQNQSQVTQNQKQKQNKEVQDQFHIQHNQNDQSQRNEVISMDEVMEDLRVLEQQQRDSQRLLASIKLSKQHKLEQRSSLETKLSSLKFSNGEARAQLIHARGVLSKSTREMASTKLRSERSSGNLKKFDEKLKKTLDIVRGLHGKRRKLDNAIAKVENAYRGLEGQEEKKADQIKNAEMELEDAKHRESLLMKSIQGSKMKVQEYGDDTLRLRSEMSTLEVELTSAQQLEASTKFRAESAQTDMENDEKRRQSFLAMYNQQIVEMDRKKGDLNNEIGELQQGLQEKERVLQNTWKRCLDIQKEEDLEISVSAEKASLDMDVIRTNLKKYIAGSLELKEGEADALAQEEELQQKLSLIRLGNESTIGDYDRLVVELEAKRNQEDERDKKRSESMTEYQEEQSKVADLRKMMFSLKDETESYRMDLEQKKEELDTILAGEKEKLLTLARRNEDLYQKYKTEEAEVECESIGIKEKIRGAQTSANEAKERLDDIHKQAESERKEKERNNEEQSERERKEDKLLEELRNEQMKLLKDHPCLASLDLSYDTDKSKESKIETTLSDLRTACNTRVESARDAYDYRVLIFKREMEEQEQRRLKAEESAKLEAEEARALEDKKRKQDERMRQKAEEKEKMLAEEARLSEQRNAKKTAEIARIKEKEIDLHGAEDSFGWSEGEDLSKRCSSTQEKTTSIQRMVDSKGIGRKNRSVLDSERDNAEDLSSKTVGTGRKTRTSYGSKELVGSTASRGRSRARRVLNRSYDEGERSDKKTKTRSSKMRNYVGGNGDANHSSDIQNILQSEHDTAFTPKSRVDKVRFQEKPTITDTFEIDQSMSLTQSSSSKKRPRSIIVKSGSRMARKSRTETLDIFSQLGTSSTREAMDKSRPTSSKDGRSALASDDRQVSSRRKSRSSSNIDGEKGSSKRSSSLKEHHSPSMRDNGDESAKYSSSFTKHRSSSTKRSSSKERRLSSKHHKIKASRKPSQERKSTSIGIKKSTNSTKHTRSSTAHGSSSSDTVAHSTNSTKRSSKESESLSLKDDYTDAVKCSAYSTKSQSSIKKDGSKISRNRSTSTKQRSERIDTSGTKSRKTSSSSSNRLSSSSSKKREPLSQSTAHSSNSNRRRRKVGISDRNLKSNTLADTSMDFSFL